MNTDSLNIVIYVCLNSWVYLYQLGGILIYLKELYYIVKELRKICKYGTAYINVERGA